MPLFNPRRPYPRHTHPRPSYAGGRLQRPAGDNQGHIGSFRQVIYRHGLTMGVIAALCLQLPDGLEPINQTTENAFTNPLGYLLGAAALAVFFVFYQRRTSNTVSSTQLLWIGYLLYVSVVEELAFRLLLPIGLATGIELTTAIVISNVIFAAIHYVTLRWRWQNCLFAFIGGLGFAHLLHTHQDLTLVILAHWFFTFLNTPAPPGKPTASAAEL